MFRYTTTTVNRIFFLTILKYRQLRAKKYHYVFLHDPIMKINFFLFEVAFWSYLFSVIAQLQLIFVVHYNG